jgi:RHS repeat-associated protein
LDEAKIKDQHIKKNRKTGANPVFFIPPTALKTKNNYIYIMKSINGDPNNSGIAINPVNDVNTKVPSGWPGQVVFAPAGGPPGAPIQYGDSITNSTVEPGFGYLGNGNVEENLRYFFHSDHPPEVGQVLGSTSYITNANGEITQFVGYMPFGEAFMEQHTDYDSPFKFNGKEMDSETGLCYYGARFYDPKIAVFHGVDPLAEKYSNWTPYNYCYNNPIKFIDPTGMEGEDTHIYDLKGNYVTTIDDNHKDEIVFMDGLFAQGYKRMNEKNKGNNKELNQLGSNARNRAKARFTQNTANELKKSLDNALSKTKYNEPGGFLWIDPNTKELKVWTAEGKGNRFSPSLLENFDIESNGEPFAIWHGHDGIGNYAAQPTEWEDFTAGEEWIKNNSKYSKYIDGGVVGAIVTTNTTTIYRIYQGYLDKPLKQKFGSLDLPSWPAYRHNGVKFITNWWDEQ